MSGRTLARIVPAVDTADGAGVRLRRSLGQHPEARLDPFLLLDEFASEDPGDYVAGFPAHPHRGFETVTYMIEGHLRHEDHLGHRGELRSGGVQWMRAGRGIIHSEMPQQERGRLHGFQLWINLPAAEKMQPASYRDIPAAQIPVCAIAGGAVRVIAGAFAADGQRVLGPVQGLSTEPLYLHLRLDAGAALVQDLPVGHNALVYPFAGTVAIGGAPLATASAGVLGGEGPLEVRAGALGAECLLLAGRPLGEPVVQYGPFVMNTRAQIQQAIEDFERGHLAD